MELLINIAPMDEKTLHFFIDCIDSAPNQDSLDGIRVSLEWFYSIDKDLQSFNYLINRISEKEKIL